MHYPNTHGVSPAQVSLRFSLVVDPLLVLPKNMADERRFSSSATPRATVHGKHPLPAPRPFTGKQDREHIATSFTTRPPALECPPAHP